MEAITDPESLLRQARTSLANREFSSSQKLAAQAMVHNSDPALAAESRGLLAVAGILLAGHRRDLYDVLRISRADSEDSQIVWSRYSELAETLTKPELNNVPFAQEAYDLTFHAFSVLSDPEKKSQYDAEAGKNSPAPTSFWTVCPYCFWVFQYGKEYEECCLRCQNCSRAFHGVSIGEPPAEVIVPGSDRYLLCDGVFPLGYRVKEKGFEGRTGDLGGGSWGKRVPKALARRMKNVKAVARKKKI